MKPKGNDLPNLFPLETLKVSQALYGAAIPIRAAEREGLPIYETGRRVVRGD